METLEIIDSRDLDPNNDPDDDVLWVELAENCDEHPNNGITLVRADSFVQYTKDFAADCGYLSVTIPTYNRAEGYNVRDELLTMQWPFDHIDWDAAAEALKEDYVEVTYKGVTYYAR